MDGKVSAAISDISSKPKPGRRKLNAIGLDCGSHWAPGTTRARGAAQRLFRHSLKAFASKGALVLQVLANGNQLVIADALFGRNRDGVLQRIGGGDQGQRRAAHDHQVQLGRS